MLNKYSKVQQKEKNLDTVYLDNAATTKPYTEVVEAALHYMTKEYGNPGGNYKLGETARQAVNDAMKTIAEIINGKYVDIFFTSGGSESDNLALKGLGLQEGDHIITTMIEHKAILKTCQWLEAKYGVEVTYLQPNERGLITADQVEKAITPKTKVVSVMAVNNEVGTIQPIKDIGTICRKNNIIFHVDAVQGFCHIPINVREMKIDMLSASAHKFHGLKGVGFLYSRVPLKESLIHGGSQGKGFRAGTENVPGIVAMAKAAEIASKRMPIVTSEIVRLRDYMIERILTEIPKAELNGSLVVRSANNVNVSIPGVNGETLLLLMNEDGICASTGSACNSFDGKPSHVLKAMGLSDEECRGSLRFTLSEFNTIEDIDRAVDSLVKCVKILGVIK